MSSIRTSKSLYIPCVFVNFTSEYLENAFGIFGKVSRIDIVPQLFARTSNGKPYNAVYIHFSSFYTNDDNFVALERDIESQSKYHFYHDLNSPYYWIVLPNKSNSKPGERKQVIDLGKKDYINVNDAYVNAPEIKSKNSYASVVKANIKQEEKENEQEKEEEMMREIEEAMIEEDELYNSNIGSFDCRYVQCIEEENMWLRTQLQQAQAELSMIHNYLASRLSSEI